MRQLLAVLFVGLAAATLSATPQGAAKVEVKGPHLCCKQCVNIVGTLLGKVDGVSEVMADIKSKTVTFTAKDDKAAKAGVDALVAGGFFGTAKVGDKELKIETPEVKKGEKAKSVTVKDVHVCCGLCVKEINKIFDGSKVTIEGNGAQRTVIVQGDNLDRAEVLETLKKAGFFGKLEK